MPSPPTTDFHPCSGLWLLKGFFDIDSVVVTTAAFEIDSIGSINLATSLQISEIKAIFACHCYLLTQPSIALSAAIIQFIPSGMRIEIQYPPPSPPPLLWMDAGKLQSRMQTHLHIETTGGGCVAQYQVF